MSTATEPLWVPFRYFAFWDVPRALVVEHGGGTLLLDCPWDDAADDYPEHFDVYAVPGTPPPGSSWQRLVISAIARGRIPVASVRFDETRRRFVDARCLPF